MTITAAAVVGIIGFFGGTLYQKSQGSTFQNGQMRGQFGQGRNITQGTRPVMGEIIAQDDKSITVKIQDGSTKIIILSDQTSINKATTGTKSDLKTGERISAFGNQNSDGSVTAQSVSIGEGMFRGQQGNTLSPAVGP